MVAGLQRSHGEFSIWEPEVPFFEPIKFEGKGNLISARPVADFPMQFRWYREWEPIFDRQIDLVRQDIARAKAEDKFVLYLSCPISSRGGSHSLTNVAIARFTERRLLIAEWGQRFWFLNPAQYQLESKEGTGLIFAHAKALGLSVKDLAKLPPPSGGDYMRMWTKVLVEDDDLPFIRAEDRGKFKNCGRNFDAYYFIGAADMRRYFTSDGTTNISAAIEENFVRQYGTDPDFANEFSVDGIKWGQQPSAKNAEQQDSLRFEWERRRKDFFRYYSLRAGVFASKGSHDEWNILRHLNEKRMTSMPGAVGDRIAAFYDGCQVDLGAMITSVPKGYEL
jgi:hypothetical protein